jgi:hypothetical protein
LEKCWDVNHLLFKRIMLPTTITRVGTKTKMCLDYLNRTMK